MLVSWDPTTLELVLHPHHYQVGIVVVVAAVCAVELHWQNIFHFALVLMVVVFALLDLLHYVVVVDVVVVMHDEEVDAGHVVGFDYWETPGTLVHSAALPA